jgi:hypothetical protein
MAIEKSLSQAPMGIESLMMEPELDIEIEIDLPDEGSFEEQTESPAISFDGNLAEEISDSELQLLAQELLSDYQDDLDSRKDWMQTYVDGLELLGLKIEERSEPWEGACGIYHPILAEALVKFQAETMMATFPAQGPVRTQIIGKETTAKKESANRVQDDMNYQLMDRMKEYRPEHERMLWGLGLSGNAFKKVYFDPHLNRQVSAYVPAEDIVVPYGASSLQTAERVTHTMRKTENELRRLQVAGFYRDIELDEPATDLDEVEKKIAEKLGFRATMDSRYKVLEMMVDLDLLGYEDMDEDGNETGIKLPYIVTIEKGTSTILAIRRNWKEDDDTQQKRQHFVHYGYIPGFGFYCFGLIHLLGAYAKSGTSITRQLVDAGTLSNLPGGFKTRGLRVKGDDTPIAPGEFRDVDVPSGAIKDNILPLPYKEPSLVLAGLLDKIIAEARAFASSGDLKISDMSSQAPVGTTMAILERTLKTTSAIQARIYYSMQQEFELLKEIIAENCVDYDYEPEEGSRKVKKEDYECCDVIPVSDPNASTMAQKIVQHQAVLQLASQAPQLYNMPLLHRQMLEVLGVKHANKLIPLEEDQKPVDPITENQNVLMGKPVKAFAYQKHPAHIEVHMAAMQDPKILMLLQNNPMAPQLQAAMMAHINEHLGFEYRVQIEQQLGFSLPPQKDEAGEDAHMDPQVEAQLAPMLAQAAQRLLHNNIAEVQQQQNTMKQKDPLVQLQQQEMQLKQAELQMKQQNNQAEIQIKQQQLQVEQLRIQSQHDSAMQTQQLIAQTKEKQMQINAASKLAELHQNSGEVKIDALKHVASLEHERKSQKQNMIHEGMKHATTEETKRMQQQEQPMEGD